MMISPARAIGGIDDVAHRQLALDFRGVARVGDLHHFRFIEDAQQVGVIAVVGVHRPQQRHDGKLPALVDADGEALLAVDVQFDPASAFGNDAAALQAALAGALDLADEIHAGAAVELADHHPLGPVDDELAAAEHDGDVAEVDFLLDGLLFGQPQPDLEGPAVGEAELAALVGLVTRLAEFVADVLQAERLVIAFDGEDLPQYAFHPLVVPLRSRDLILQKSLVAARLDFGQVGDEVRRSKAAEATNFLRLEPSLSQGGHKGLPFYEKVQYKQSCRRSPARAQHRSGGGRAATPWAAVRLPPPTEVSRGHTPPGDETSASRVTRSDDGNAT